MQSVAKKGPRVKTLPKVEYNKIKIITNTSAASKLYDIITSHCAGNRVASLRPHSSQFLHVEPFVNEI